MRAFVAASILGLWVFGSGCGVLLQSAIGWTDRSELVVDREARLEITSTSTGADIFERERGRDDRLLGSSPQLVVVPYRATRTVETPRWVGLLIGGLVEGGVAGVVVAQAAHSNGPDAAPPILAGYTVALALGEIIAAFAYGSSDPVIASERPDHLTRTYVVKRNGAEGVADVKLPTEERVSIALGDSPELRKLALEEAKTATAAKPKPPEKRPRAVAVLALIDAPGAQSPLEASVIARVEAQLAAAFHARGRRVTPLDDAKRAEANAVEREKCPGEGCNLEVGRTLGVNELLRTRVTRVGQRCAMHAELLDVWGEATLATSSAQSTCDATGLETTAQTIVDRLASLVPSEAPRN